MAENYRDIPMSVSLLIGRTPVSILGHFLFKRLT
jgi:hypothetical protein